MFIIYGVDSSSEYSLCGKFGHKLWIEKWRYPNIGIAICGTVCGGHDIIFLDYSDCGPEGEPCVVNIDQEADYEITYLADNFKDLLNNWSKVGCVGGEDWQWEPFYTEGKGIDSECENAKLWREYIFSKI